MSNEPVFSLDIPVKIDNLKFVFFLSQTLRTTGNECATYPHNHGYYEIRYTVLGKGTQVLESEIFDTSPGDLLLIQPYTYHYQPEQSAMDDLEQYCLGFSIKPPQEKANAEQKRSYDAMVELLNSIHKINDSAFTVLPYFKLLVDEIHHKKYGYCNYLQSICTIILSQMIRLSEIVHPKLFISPELKYTSFYRVQIDRFLRHRFKENVKIQDLADEMKVSVRQVSRILMKEYGVNYTQKMLEIRLEYAKSELLHSDKKIQEVCRDCGIQRYTYFITCFKKATGMTPSEYKKLFAKK